VFGPGQVTWEGATGAIAAFAARALEGRPIVIPGNPARTRDFVYVDDLVDGLERLAGEGPWDAVLHAGSGTATSLEDAARLVLAAVGGEEALELPGGTLPPGEDLSYADDPGAARVAFAPRPLAEGVDRYVAWLRAHPAAQGRARA
jgi:nucleoside-diphosphate-sugar epimerase